MIAAVARAPWQNPRVVLPLMMVFLGGIVGGLLIAMYAPIFEMAGNIKAG